MKILLDGHGGDNAPFEMVMGAIDTVEAYKDLKITIVGKQKEIEPILNQNYSGKAIDIINADEVIGNDEVPTLAIREKQNSSMVVGLKLLRDDVSYSGMVSAGSTGALLTGALLICKRIKGITRPALVPMAPTATDKKFVLVDCGANADCKPVNLQHFALMGSAFITAMFGEPNPKVALLSNGTEEGKGNELTKETHMLLKEMKNINFVGNIEARDMLSGEYDVVVCDGFTGNVALKSSEGMAKAILSMIKQGINEKGIVGKIGALCLKSVFKKIKKRMDVNEQAGGAFMGIERIVVKAHGSSSRVSVKACIEQAMTLAQNNIVDNIKISLAQMGAISNEQ